MTQFSLPLRPRLNLLRSLLQTLIARPVRLAGMQIYVPGPLTIRLSVILGNLRMQRMLDVLVRPGATVVDVGANIGYNTLYAAQCAGPQGRVYAIEPAQDNLAILYANLFANRLTNVIVLPYAAGRVSARRHFFLRGDVSAVNSLFEENFYAPVSATVEVLAAPLDELVPGVPDLVKIDVEGGELDVLQGMSRILAAGTVRLILEWHPTLQQAAGYAPDALPRFLLTQGYTVQMVSHTQTRILHPPDLPALTSKLLQARSPIELLATH